MTKPKPKFRVDQIVWYRGELKKIARITPSGVRFEPRRGWEYRDDVWDNLAECCPLTARDVGPGWVRKEAKYGKR